MGGWLEVSWFDDRLAPNTATLADGHQGTHHTIRLVNVATRADQGVLLRSVLLCE